VTWFSETVEHAYRQSFKVERSIYRGRTAYQEIEIFENALFGRVLALDGVVQTTERDEYIYHEMIVHVPLFGHGGARRVLIIGGGDGGALEEALKHPVEQVTMVDLDAQVIELCRRHLPSVSAGAFEDPRLELVIGDGASFVAESGRRFDVIVVDSTDPVGPGVVLFESPFYESCRASLHEGGVLVAQCSTPYEYPDVLRESCARLERLFTHVGAFIVGVPSYGGAYMGFAWASDSVDLAHLPLTTLEQRYAQAAIETRHYTPAFHASTFVLPADIGRLLP
jgi:spermidine synthase